MTATLRAVTLAALFATTALPALAETPDDQLVVGFSMTNVLTLDPAAITGREPVQILANVYDGLVTLDPKDRSKVNPDLAESWDIADDGSTITFHLRDGATFASGNPVTAEDVVWSLNRLMTLNLAQASFLKTHGFTAANAATSFTAPDAKTVVVTLPKPVDPKVIVQTLGIVGPGSILDTKLVMENEKDGDMGAGRLGSVRLRGLESERPGDPDAERRLLGRTVGDEAHHHAPHPGKPEPAADAREGRSGHRLLARRPGPQGIVRRGGGRGDLAAGVGLLLPCGVDEGRPFRQPEGARGAALSDRLQGD
jgi:hypothetical protein